MVCTSRTKLSHGPEPCSVDLSLQTAKCIACSFVLLFFVNWLVLLPQYMLATRKQRQTEEFFEEKRKEEGIHLSPPQAPLCFGLRARRALFLGFQNELFGPSMRRLKHLTLDTSSRCQKKPHALIFNNHCGVDMVDFGALPGKSACWHSILN